MATRATSLLAILATLALPAVAQPQLVFDEPVEIVSTPGHPRATQMRMARGIGRHLIVAWYGRDEGGTGLYLAHSIDNGHTWSSSSPLTSDAPSDEFNDSVVRLASNGNGICVALWSRWFVTEESRHLMSSRSIDDGITWSDPQTVIARIGERDLTAFDVASDGGETFMLIWGYLNREFIVSRDAGETWSASAAIPDGSGVLTWLKTIIGLGPRSFLILAGNDDGVDVTTTNNAGETWTNPKLLTSPGQRPPHTLPGRPQATAAASDGAGNVVIYWIHRRSRAVTDNARDVIVARSSDGGRSWSEPDPLYSHPDSSAYSSLRLATDGRVCLAVWGIRDRGGFYVVSDDRGANWSQPQQILDDDRWWSPVDLVGGLGQPFVYSKVRDNNVFIFPEFDRERGWSPPIRLMEDISLDQPDVANSRGRWMTVWRHTRNQSEFALQVAHSDDVGVSWSTPRAVFQAGDRPLDSPRIIAGHEGRWAVVFRTDDEETGNGILFISHSEDNGTTWSHPVPLTGPDQADRYASSHSITRHDHSGDWMLIREDPRGRWLTSISRNDGQTWSPDAIVVDDDDISQVRLTPEPSGRWLAVWRTAHVHIAASEDGLSWAELPLATEQLPRIPFEPAFPPTVASVAADPAGSLLLVYREDVEDVEQVIVSTALARRSLDAGLTWSAPESVYSQFGQIAYLRPLAVASDSWLVLHSKGGAKRSTDGGEWNSLDTLGSLFGQVADDGAGNYMVAQRSGKLAISAKRFGLAKAAGGSGDEPDDVQDQQTPAADSGDETDRSDDAQGQTPPSGAACPAAAVVLMMASTLALLAVRRR